MSTAPRPHTSPSTSSPPKGSRRQPSGLTGTTSVWPMSSRVGRRRVGALDAGHQRRPARRRLVGLEVEAGALEVGRRKSTLRVSWPDSAVPSLTQALRIRCWRRSVTSPVTSVVVNARSGDMPRACLTSPTCLPADVVVDGSNLATEGRTLPSLAQLDEAVQEFSREYPGTEITVVVDATFGHRIDESERRTFEEAELAGEIVSPPAGAIGRGDAFLLRIAEKVGRHRAVQRLLPGVPRRARVAVRQGPADRRQAGARRRVDLHAPLAGAGPPQPPPGPPPRGAAPRRPSQPGGGGGGGGRPAAAAKARRPSGPSWWRRRSRWRSKRRSSPTRRRPVAAAAAVGARRRPIPSTRRWRSSPLWPSTRPDRRSRARSTRSRRTAPSCLSAAVRCYLPLTGISDPPPPSARSVLKRGEPGTFRVRSFDPPRRGIELALDRRRRGRARPRRPSPCRPSPEAPVVYPPMVGPRPGEEAGSQEGRQPPEARPSKRPSPEEGGDEGRAGQEGRRPGRRRARQEGRADEEGGDPRRRRPRRRGGGPGLRRRPPRQAGEPRRLAAKKPHRPRRRPGAQEGGPGQEDDAAPRRPPRRR